MNDLGARGELAAARYYRQKGYMLLHQNYRTRFGELDLVLYREGTLVFAEVKTRKPGAMVRGALAVDARKQQRLILAAQQYLQNSPYAQDTIRFDVVEVEPCEKGWRVHCIMDAFTL